MTLQVVISVVAILLAPLIALRVNVRLNERKESENRKLEVFRNLMSSRAAGLSKMHVEALSRIDVEFYGTDKKTKEVSDAWKEYRDHLSIASKIKPEESEKWTNWSSKKEDLLTELLYKMAIRMGYDFDRVHIKRGHYYPQGYVDIETEHSIIRKGFVNIFQKKDLFPILAFPYQEESKEVGQLVTKEQYESSKK